MLEYFFSLALVIVQNEDYSEVDGNTCRRNFLLRSLTVGVSAVIGPSYDADAGAVTHNFGKDEVLIRMVPTREIAVCALPAVTRFSPRSFVYG